MKLALSTHLFVFHVLDEKILDLISREGFPDIELWGMHPHLDHRDREGLIKLFNFMQCKGLGAVSFHAPFYRWESYAKEIHWLSLADPGEEGRHEAVKEIKKVVDILDIFDCSLLVVHAGISGSKEWRQERAQSLKSLEELALYCGDRGVQMALENGVNQNTSPGAVREIVDNFPPEILGICLDLGHANITGDSSEAVTVCGERLIHLHVSDNYGKSDDHRIPFDGTVNWNAVKESLESVGFSRAFTYELRYWGQDDPQGDEDFALYLSRARKTFEKLLGQRDG